jgi:preprotein translocase subunit SecA
MRHGVIAEIFRSHVPAESVEEQWDLAGLERALAADLLIGAPAGDWVKSEPTLSDEEMLARIVREADAAYAAKVDMVGAPTFHQFERNIMLQSLDTHWREHLSALDHLRQGIHLRGYAQKNPKQEYKREAFELFEGLLDAVRKEVTRVVFTVQIRSQEDVEETVPHADVQNVQYQHAEFDEVAGGGEAALPPPQQPAQAGPKVGRNDPCPCGSGKKYKHCHGKLS